MPPQLNIAPHNQWGSFVGPQPHPDAAIVFRQEAGFPYLFLMPESALGDLWSMVVLLLVLMQAITIPIETAFDVQVREWVLRALT